MVSFMKYISITSRCAIQYRSEQLAGSDLNGFQCTYILYICKNPGVSQEQLARMMVINKSNVTRQLAVLSEAGYVERRNNDADKRIIEVYPTQKALDILPEIKKLFHDWNDYITDGFTEEEKTVLKSMLERIAEKAKQFVDKNTLTQEKE